MGRMLQTRRATGTPRVWCGAVAGAERKTSAAEVETPQVRRASKADDQRSGLSWVSRCILGPMDMWLQACCANNDVEGWVCRPVITSPTSCLVGVLGARYCGSRNRNSCRPVRFQGGLS